MSVEAENCTELWQKLRRSEIAHLDPDYGHSLAEDTPFGLELPYHSLGGPGFERLCYHILVSQGKAPRFYGTPGQAQFGIDLIDSDGSRCDVFQCKNVAGFDAKALEIALDDFQMKWGTPDEGFPRPASFTICTTEKITDRTAWDKVKSTFHGRTGIRVKEWDKTYLDEILTKLPDAVADLFGDPVAERFCDGLSWNDGLWVRLLPRLDRTIDRFLGLEAKRNLVLYEALTEAFDEIRSRGETVLVEGLSGVGKSVAGLALAKRTGQRVMYIDVLPELTADDLFRGITSRTARDTVFVLDNCHRNWDIVETATNRVRRAMGRRRYTLIQIGQTSPEGAELVSTGVVDYVAQLREEKSTIRIEPDLDLFRDVLRGTKPVGLSTTYRQVENLYNLTAGNLAVLDLVLRSGIDPDRSDMAMDALAADIAKAWFPTASPIAPVLHAFSSIAQFDLTIPAGTSWPSEELKEYEAAINRFVLRQAGISGRSAPQWQFTHAREAELLSQVLSIVGGQVWQTQAARHIRDHLLGMSDDIQSFCWTLSRVLQGRLTLSDDSALKAKVLVNPQIISLVSANIEDIPLPTLSLATFALHKTETESDYPALLSQKISLVLKGIDKQQPSQIGLIGPALRALGNADMDELEVVLSDAGVDRVLHLICENGTLVELFKVLEYSTPGFAASLIAALDKDIVDALINKTIEEGRSIGTLSFTLRDLAGRNLTGGGSQLEALESQLGGAPMLHLIRENGTLVELFKVLGYSTPGFAASLIAALDKDIVDALINKTIKAGRSIGTLGFTLRDLAGRNLTGGGSQLEALESLLGGAPMLHLIRENGTLVELFKVLEYSTPGFAASLIAALDKDIVDALINKTIEAGRSIGTLGFMLRDLAGRKLNGGGSQLEALESQLGGAPMLHLIRENGTLVELFKVLGYSTPGFAASLIAALDKDIVDALINKTIEAGRSIGTLNYTFRKLARKPGPDGQDQRRALERMISASVFWRLVTSNGDLNDLAYLFGEISSEYLIELFDPDIMPNRQQWGIILRNGTFFSLARFYADALQTLPIPALHAFNAAAEAEIAVLAASSSWYELSTGLARLSHFKGQPIPDRMEAAVADRAASCTLTSVFDLDFGEACTAIRTLWNYAPGHRQEIAERIWEILPELSDWPSDYRLLHHGSILFPVISEAEFSAATALSIIEVFWPTLPSHAVATAGGGVISAFLWNLQELLEVRNGENGLTQPRALPDDAKMALLRRLDDLTARASSNADKLAVLSLAGVLTYYWPELRPEIDRAVRGKIRGFRFLLEEALTLPFGPSVLASIGLTFTGPARLVFSPERTSKLLTSLEDYDEISGQTRALETFLRSKS